MQKNMKRNANIIEKEVYKSSFNLFLPAWPEWVVHKITRPVAQNFLNHP